MNHRIRLLTSSKNRVWLLAALLLSLLMQTACLTAPLRVVGEMPTPIVTLVLDPDREQLPPAPLPDATVAPPTAPLPTQASPHLITYGETAVYLGPGLDYGLSHFLGPDTTAPILGRNEEGSWLAIHGPGDGAGPHSWVAADAVTVEGPIDTLPILPSPPLGNLPDLPLVGETGLPPTGRCVVAHPGQTEPVNVHLGPGEQFALIARLDVNHWAEGIQEQVAWYEIRLGAGQVGWVAATAVAVNELC